MAELDLKFYENTDTYSDGDIEETLLQLAESGFDITKSDKVYPFAAAYHFSPQRENILNWYPFAENCRCLEIGAGCGAITGMLCEKCAEVVSVDISERRSRINYARHKNCDNLKIMAGNIQKISFDKKFDVVVLNGVFEYALSFIHTNTPYESLLRLAKSFLNPDGRVFIAIENRMGLKYLNGAAEDHTDNYFLGMNDYEGNDSVRTFTKGELSELAEKAGFNSVRFYYPYPDYKFPFEIFTDNTVNHGFGAPYMNLNMRSFGLYSEQKMSASLCKEGVMGHFANSFLLELSQGKCCDTIDYVKINSLRKPEYQIMTAICRDKDKFALKLPVSQSAHGHIEKMLQNTDIYPDGILALNAAPYKGGAKYEFLEHKSLNEIITEDTGEKPVSTALKAFFDRFETQKKSFFNDKFKAVFGSFAYEMPLDCIRPANIDLICDNIFFDNGKYVIIDNEWCFDMDIPLQFVVWRCINELYYKNPVLEERETKSSVFELFGIDEKMSRAFVNWAVHFADKYVGMNYLMPYIMPLNQLSLLDIYNERAVERAVNTACYYDTGNGYSEENKVYTDIYTNIDGGFEVTFPIPDAAKSVRWDIAEGRLLKCRVDSIENKGDASIIPDNAEKCDDGYDIFYTTDPHYTITGLVGNSFTIKGKIKNFTTREAYDAAQATEAGFAKTLCEKEKTISQKDELLNEKQTDLRLDAKYIRACENRMNAYFSQLINKQSELDARQRDIDTLNTQLEYYRSENDRIRRSKGWRFMSVFWNIKAKLTNRGNKK